jgi:hypothetical protein
MVKKEVLDYTSKNKYTVSFFEDDSIDVIRQQLAKSVHSHPDRLFILVGLKLPANYYATDPRRWEALFDRMSYNGQPIDQISFNEYQQNYRLPNATVPYKEYDKAEWMTNKDALLEKLQTTSEFLEYRILGVEEHNSFILPLDINSQLVSRIPSARIPIPQNTKLVSSLYDVSQIDRFLIRRYDDIAEPAAMIYYPLMRTNTPEILSDESINLLNKNANLLNTLLELNAPEPEKVTVVKTRFYVPWVDTDFGSAIRTRFEQLFYGLTVSDNVPYIGYFTSKDQVTRHKFFVEDPNNKKIDEDAASNWNTWWSLTKPVRNIPTLLLYRGESKHHFDRVAITAKDMVISTHRPEGNEDTVDGLRKEMVKWIQMFDSILPFIDESDLNLERWELQDVSILAKYPTKLDDFDLLRFHCISSVFDISDKSKSQFSLMRTDHENDGISSVEVKLLQMIKEGLTLKASEVAEELSISIGEAGLLIRKIEDRLDEDPKLGDRAFRGYPTMRLSPESVLISSVRNVEFPIKYANILRYILSNPDDDDLDKVCQKRGQRVSIESSAILPADLDVDSAVIDEYSDLFGYLEQSEDLKDETATTTQSVDEVQRISTDQGQKTIYSYFKNRLQKFDPDTFDFRGSQYPKKCEQKHQPIILSSDDVQRIEKTQPNYDILKKLESDKIIDLENPDGKLICPEYWCMRDQIPLEESQLDYTTASARCPVCKGKLQTESSDDPREFPLVKRESGFTFPGYVNYKSPKNGKNLPCCFKKSRANKNAKQEDDDQDKYYILGETKTGIKQYRNSFLSDSLAKSLGISEAYELLKGRRLSGGMSGFFRVGMGMPSTSMPTFLNLKTTIQSPRDSIKSVLKCSFMRSWSRSATDTYKHTVHVKNALKLISPFDEDELALENVSSIICGIDEAFEKNELTRLENLEYSAIVLDCDVFRIFTETNTLGCMFYVPMVRPRSRGIIVLQDDDDIDILSFVRRQPRGFEYRSNVFEEPFKKDTYVRLEQLRNTSCLTEIPSYTTALKVIPGISDTDYSIILDPFGRGQAFYIPDKVILPFQSTPLPNVDQVKIAGYQNVTNLPSLSDVKKYLATASKSSKGYAWKEDLYNTKKQIVEVLTESGLRIPVKPEDSTGDDAAEVFETLQAISESELAFGPQSKEIKQDHDNVSYESEVYEFLIFQLTKDLEGDEYKLLRSALQEVNPKQKEVEPLLGDWFRETTQFLNIEKPIEFLSKIRTPCGKTKDECGGNMCAWDGKVCRIKIRDSVPSDKLLHRILSTLLENSKIRSIVLDGRTTPFFSTVLYLELPNELIVTDNELSDIVDV